MKLATANSAIADADTAVNRLRDSDILRRASESTGKMTPHPTTMSMTVPAVMACRAFLRPTHTLPNDDNQPK
ncbi:hypothetical protein FHX68_0126 [Microbacterium lacticum]|uniref:Uncharacterized protein n=1 Tax=Microbacterium lacticum TaxID=33885 RepID=A0A543KYA8_9MICO|nr:hypothetical protein FHX68_0126 [Microbacterium lacticum]